MSVFRTNINHLEAVQKATKRSRKMDTKETPIMLGAENKERLNKAVEAIGEAIRLLGDIK